ncbi:MAG TPA: DUF4142 domain-containing protein [Bryobacteraceae bacterium]|nr:DUF4142 domain-containing protein [Bryobacteraceae bacterium]
MQHKWLVPIFAGSALALAPNMIAQQQAPPPPQNAQPRPSNPPPVNTPPPTNTPPANAPPSAQPNNAQPQPVPNEPAPNGQAPNGPAANNAPTETPKMDAMILSAMHSMNLMEIQMGNLAAKKGTTQQIRDFGQRLAMDHTMGDQKVMNFAKNHNIVLFQPPPNAPQPPAVQEEQSLEQAEGASFDKQFLGKMKTDHEHAIAMLQSAYDSLPQNSNLRGFVNSMNQILTQHYIIASRLDLNVTTSPGTPQPGPGPTAPKGE